MCVQGHCLGAFFKAHKERFMPHFLQSGLPEPLLQMLASEAEIHRKVGMWVWTDMVDNCADAAALYAAQIVPPMLASADMGQSADVRTAAAYGLGVCAAKLGPAAAPFGAQIMSTLLGLLRHPEARVGDNEDATDNVVSALGKVCLHQSVEGANAVLPEWLSYLPLKSDLEEAAQVHEQLCAFLERDAQGFLAPTGSALQVASVLSLGLKEEQHANGEVEHRMQSWCVNVRCLLFCCCRGLCAASSGV